MKKNKKRVLLVDDHPIMRHGLAQLIRAETDLEVCGEGGSASEGLALVGSLKPDLVVADLTLPDKHGLEFIKDVQSMYPGTLMLVLSMHDESLYAERVLRAGARGYVMKETAADMLVLAARRVLEGGIYLSEKMSSLMLEMMAGHRKPVSSSALDRLTDRELEVLQLIGQGRATRHIAEQLHVSVRTVDAHRANIKEKLQLADGATLVRYAVRWMDTQAKA
ncbi:response regulator transcription factor [Verrucomicrobium sp. BvORR106]|uniref:response regulator transcription factor n=1 Tax=Verrucomicrobium sp. BvORR106 TaxID=1403819 RepID=UPI00056F50CF|nr:response regulator transcription factor [Verrucomicrobium sp. BvORR106]